MAPLTLFWFRRDLRLEDNTGLFYALSQGKEVLPIFIFDINILSKLEDKDDARVTFIHHQITFLKQQLRSYGGDILVKVGKPEELIPAILEEFPIQEVYTNRDYEPYGMDRDAQVDEICKKKGVSFLTFKDQVIFEPTEVLTDSSSFYKVYTPYKKKWLVKASENPLPFFDCKKHLNNLYKVSGLPLPSLEEIGFVPTKKELPASTIPIEIVKSYASQRNFPDKKGTTRLGIHLRFGTVSIRVAAKIANQHSEVWLSELIWREFYMMILYHAPQVVSKAFKPNYDNIPWRKAPEDFEKWCRGETGYPIVDAGMRELKTTGFMHNRVRMITASFLTKHLLLDWRLGEAWFARHLLDFELASNNGGWQWAAGTGTDAQPYFRIFNPYSQTDKFDPQLAYIRKWVPELDTNRYPAAMVEHKFARQRALDTYKLALTKE